MNIRQQILIIPLVCLIGCASPPPATSITEENAVSIATEILRGRGALPSDYEQSVEWETDHWSIRIQQIDYDENGQRTYIIGNHPRYVYLYPNGDLLAILGDAKTTQEELMQWEDNLRQLEQNKQ